MRVTQENMVLFNNVKSPNVCLYRAEVIWTGSATKKAKKAKKRNNSGGSKFSRFVGVVI